MMILSGISKNNCYQNIICFSNKYFLIKNKISGDEILGKTTILAFHNFTQKYHILSQYNGLFSNKSVQYRNLIYVTK